MMTDLFSKLIRDHGDDPTLREIENLIQNNPEVGDLVPGGGGVRKMRVADQSRGKGKRGGLRVLYLDLPRISRTCLITIYSKAECDDMSAETLRAAAEWARTIKSRLE